MKKVLFSILLCGGSVFLFNCDARTTGANEVGLRIQKLFSPGIEQKIYPPGTTQFFLPFTSDWVTFDTKLQRLEMVEANGQGDRADNDAIKFKTIDGNDISIDVTVSWRIEPQKTPSLIVRVGHSTEEIKERLVRPLCRTYIRDSFNELHSEEFYVAEKRYEKVKQAEEKLKADLGTEGIIIEQVQPGEYHFNELYSNVIKAKKDAEQLTERLKSESIAAEAEQNRNLENAKGDVQVDIATAKGTAEQIKISADQRFYEAERNAKATLAEKTAQAKAIEQQNKSMAGAGGRTAIKLQIAEALKGKPIVLIPAGGGANLQKLDINRLVESLIAQEAQAPSPSPPTQN